MYIDWNKFIYYIYYILYIYIYIYIDWNKLIGTKHCYNHFCFSCTAFRLTGLWLVLQVVAVTMQCCPFAALESFNAGTEEITAVVKRHTTLFPTCVALQSLASRAATTPAVLPGHTTLLSPCVAMETFNPT